MPNKGPRKPHKRIVSYARSALIEMAIARGYTREHMISELNFADWEITAIWDEMNRRVSARERQKAWKQP